METRPPPNSKMVEKEKARQVRPDRAINYLGATAIKNICDDEKGQKG